MNYFLAAIELSSFIIYGLALSRVFSDESGIDLRMQILKGLATLFALIHFYFLWHLPGSVDLMFILSFSGYLTGLWVFFNARKALTSYRLTLAFSEDTPKTIIKNGIYRYIRHPFYLAYCTTWISGVIAAPTFLTAITAMIMFLFYWYAASLEESKFALSELSGQYSDYKKQAGMFLPNINVFFSRN